MRRRRRQSIAVSICRYTRSIATTTTTPVQSAASDHRSDSSFSFIDIFPTNTATPRSPLPSSIADQHIIWSLSTPPIQTLPQSFVAHNGLCGRSRSSARTRSSSDTAFSGFVVLAGWQEVFSFISSAPLSKSLGQCACRHPPFRRVVWVSLLSLCSRFSPNSQ